MSTEFVMSDEQQRRFWSRVTLPDENGCMLWTARLDSSGYGRIQMGVERSAHRLSLHLAVGAPAGPSLQAAHSCRNRRCVAPAHLRWATKAENEADKALHGVAAAGERQFFALLTNRQAAMIRQEAAQGTPRAELVEKYGVTKKVVGDLLRGRTYRVADAKAGA